MDTGLFQFLREPDGQPRPVNTLIRYQQNTADPFAFKQRGTFLLIAEDLGLTIREKGDCGAKYSLESAAVCLIQQIHTQSSLSEIKLRFRLPTDQEQKNTPPDGQSDFVTSSVQMSLL